MEYTIRNKDGSTSRVKVKIDKRSPTKGRSIVDLAKNFIPWRKKSFKESTSDATGYNRPRLPLPTDADEEYDYQLPYESVSAPYSDHHVQIPYENVPISDSYHRVTGRSLPTYNNSATDVRRYSEPTFDQLSKSLNYPGTDASFNMDSEAQNVITESTKPLDNRNETIRSRSYSCGTSNEQISHTYMELNTNINSGRSHQHKETWNLDESKYMAMKPRSQSSQDIVSTNYLSTENDMWNEFPGVALLSRYSENDGSTVDTIKYGEALYPKGHPKTRAENLEAEYTQISEYGVADDNSFEMMRPQVSLENTNDENTDEIPSVYGKLKRNDQENYAFHISCLSLKSDDDSADESSIDDRKGYLQKLNKDLREKHPVPPAEDLSTNSTSKDENRTEKHVLKSFKSFESTFDSIDSTDGLDRVEYLQNQYRDLREKQNYLITEGQLPKAVSYINAPSNADEKTKLISDAGQTKGE